MIKTFFGYDIRAGLTDEEYERWLWNIYVPSCLANPHLDRIVFNSVRSIVRGEQTFHGMSEFHFRDTEAFRCYTDGNIASPGAIDHGSAARTQAVFHVLASDVDVDRTRLSRLISDPEARSPTTYPQPGAKAILGYDIMPNLTPEAYDQWLWEIHAPDLLENPYLQRIVFNTVQQKLSGDRSFFRISELHFSDMESYANFEEWRAANPVPIERSPVGRTAFRFYVVTTVRTAERG